MEAARVVLVEDEELISTMVRLNLEHEGFHVRHFDTAEAMLEFVTADPGAIDIVLLDIMLPGMDGAQALAELRRRAIAVPVMMLTAKSDVDSRVSALEGGADDYLPKPFNVRELVARVHALLRRGSRINNYRKDA